MPLRVLQWFVENILTTSSMLTSPEGASLSQTSSGRKTVVVPRRGQKRGREDTEVCSLL